MTPDRAVPISNHVQLCYVDGTTTPVRSTANNPQIRAIPIRHARLGDEPAQQQSLGQLKRPTCTYSVRAVEGGPFRRPPSLSVRRPPTHPLSTSGPVLGVWRLAAINGGFESRDTQAVADATHKLPIVCRLPSSRIAGGYLMVSESSSYRTKRFSCN